MKLLMTGSQIARLPVVTIEGGDDVAEVRDIVYGPDAGRIVGLTLNKRGFFSGRLREVLPAQAIHAIGRDAVMILNESQLADADDAPEDVGHPDASRNVIGDDVLTEGGESLGTVRDLVVLAGSTGEVVGYQIDKTERGVGYIPLPVQLSISGSALIVPELTKEFMHDDLVGLGAAVDTFRSRLGLA